MIIFMFEQNSFELDCVEDDFEVVSSLFDFSGNGFGLIPLIFWRAWSWAGFNTEGLAEDVLSEEDEIVRTGGISKDVFDVLDVFDLDSDERTAAAHVWDRETVTSGFYQKLKHSVRNLFPRNKLWNQCSNSIS